MCPPSWNDQSATAPEEPLSPHERPRHAGLRLVVLNGSDSFTRLLDKRAYVLGRGAEADVVILAPGLSRQHARLTVGEMLTVEDCGSRNGVFVRGERLASGVAAPVAPGELIELGRNVMCIVHGRVAREQTHATSLMDQLHQLVDRVAKVDVSVLIQGETGVGKDVLARRIHAASRRAQGPFVAINCAAIAETVADSELFGHERGAFTGAQASKAGLLEAAAGGTIFLDEIGDMPASLQVKLLRVLETRELLPVGATRTRPFDARVIAATHHDLKADADRGSFRRDLYHRLDGVTLEVPPLRERRDEIAGLAEQFCDDAARELSLAPSPLTADVLARLQAYDWPGNIRELRQVMRRAVLMSGSAELALEQLPEAARPSEIEAPRSDASGLKGDLKQLERTRILEALEACAGNQTHAAQRLGISRTTLVSRMREYGVARPRKR